MRKVFVFVFSFLFIISFSPFIQAKKKTYLINISLDIVTRTPPLDKGILIMDGKIYNDDLIEIVWKWKTNELKFELRSKTDHPMSIIWEESYFIDKHKTELRITHSGIKPWNMAKFMPPTEIPSKQRIKKIIYPCEYFFQKPKLDQRPGYMARVMEWEKRPIYKRKVKLNKPDDFDFANYKKKLAEAAFEVLLTIDAAGQWYEYRFHFKPEVKEKS